MKKKTKQEISTSLPANSFVEWIAKCMQKTNMPWPIEKSKKSDYPIGIEEAYRVLKSLSIMLQP